MYLHFSLFEMLEEKLYDLRFKVRGKITPSPYVVIIAIDDKSLEKLGRWPWSWDKMAKLTEILARGGTKVIAFDILFAEPEKNVAVFAKAIRKAGNVLLPLVFRFDKETPLVQEDFLYSSSVSAIKNVSALHNFPLYKAIGLSTCRKELSGSASAAGRTKPLANGSPAFPLFPMVIEYDL